MIPAAAYTQRGLETITSLLAIGFILSFSVVALMTLSYPFHLEWMEGQTIDVVQRVLNGKPIYVEPSLEYVPFIYTPLYYYVVAFVSWFGGVEFLPARLVSMLSALGCGAIIYAWLRKENATRLISLAGAGLFFATYKLSGRWFDTARIDSLFLLLTLLGLFLLFHYRTAKSTVFAGVVMALAFFTKQLALLAIVPVLMAWILIDRRQALIAIGTTAVLMLCGMALLEVFSDGWFSFYIFTVPAGHSWDTRHILRFWSKDMGMHLGALCLLAVCILAYLSRTDKRKAWRYGALAVGLIGCSYIARLHSYGHINVFMPAHAALALFSGLALVYASRLEQARWGIAAWLLVLLQFSCLIYNPVRLVPSAEATETGNRFLEKISHIEGDVFMPELQFVQTRVGKKSYTLGMAAFDVLRSDLKDQTPIKQQLRRQLRQAIRQQRFAAVMPGRLLTLPEIEDFYVFDRHLKYPKEYIGSAIGFLRTDIYVPIETNGTD